MRFASWKALGAATYAAASLARTSLAAAQVAGENPTFRSEQLRPASLNWVRGAGADECPGPAAIAGAVESRLGREVFVAASRPELAVEAFVEAMEGGGFKLVLRMSGPDGEVMGRREFTSDNSDCSTLVEPAVLAIALMIDPEASLAAPPEPAAEPSPPSAVTFPPPAQVFYVAAPVQATVAPSATPQREPARTWRGALALSGQLAWGLQPGTAPGFSLRARVVPPDQLVGFQLGGAFFPEQEREVRAKTPIVEAVGARFSSVLLHIATCWLPDGGAGFVAGALCGGVNAGALSARGYGVRATPRANSLLVDLNLSTSVGFRLFPHVNVMLGAQLFLPTRRDAFYLTIDGVSRQVYQRPSAAGLGEIGVGLEF